MVAVRIPNVQSSRDIESFPRRWGRWKVSVQVKLVALDGPEQVIFWEPDESGVFQTVLSGTRVALTLTAPLLANGGQNLRATIAYTVANATAGKARLRVQYTIDGRGQEIQAT